MFAQGDKCFFCRKTLARADASVEHLVAVANGGKDHDENCVACCKTLNRLFGHMSLKEKLNIILNQSGDFRCPAAAQAPAPAPAPALASQPKSVGDTPQTQDQRVAAVLADLHKRGNAKPATVDKLLNTIRTKLTQIGDGSDHAEAILGELSAREFVHVADRKVTYTLPPRDA